jgi:hypothetical protein
MNKNILTLEDFLEYKKDNLHSIIQKIFSLNPEIFTFIKPRAWNLISDFLYYSNAKTFNKITLTMFESNSSKENFIKFKYYLTVDSF